MLRLPIICCLLAATAVAKPQPVLLEISDVDEHPSWDQQFRTINKDMDDQPLPVEPDASDLTGTDGDVSDITLPPGNYSWTSHSGYGSDVETGSGEDYYPLNYHKVLRLRGADGQFISFSCHRFWLEYHPTCDFDYLSVNGMKFCGKRKVTMMTATSLEVVFHADSNITMPGFSCRVEVPSPPADGFRQCVELDSAWTCLMQGGEATPEQFPCVAGVLINGKQNSSCSSNVIDNRYVMMPTRCVEGSAAGDFQVVLGEPNNGTADLGEQLFSVEEIKTRQDNSVQLPAHVSDRLNGWGLESMALLKLDGEITFTDTVRPILNPCIDDVRRHVQFNERRLSEIVPLQTQINEQQDMKLAYAWYIDMLSWIEDSTADAQRYGGV